MDENSNPLSLPPLAPPSSRASAVGIVFLELFKIVITATITIVLVRHFLFKPFYVKGESMSRTFEDGNYLVIDRLSYRLGDPERGDVIVFEYPGNRNEYFLKRIIGLPGERVKISDGIITVYNKAHPEGVVLKEVYIPKEVVTTGEKSTTLGSDEYFVMGDNRPNSYDSRRFGPIQKEEIVGRVLLRGWPLSQFEHIKTPSFNF